MIEIGKTYQARCGWPARVHATDMGGAYPVLASVQYPNGEWFGIRLTADGLYNGPNRAHDFDLIEAKPQVTFTRWVNVYRGVDGQDGHCTFLHLTEDQARSDRNVGCVMTVPVTITGREGDGL